MRGLSVEAADELREGWYTCSHILLLYADDLLLLTQYLPSPRNKLSGLKNECFPVNNTALQIPDKYFPYNISRSNFKY